MALVLNPTVVRTTLSHHHDHHHQFQQHHQQQDEQNNNNNNNNNNGKMNVFFRFIDGKTLCLWLDPTVDIQTIKKELLARSNNHHNKYTTNDTTNDNDHHGRQLASTHNDNVRRRATLSPNDLFLIWNGKPLEEDRLLHDYHMPSNATVSVSVRNRGGCFMISLSILATICAALIGSTCTCGISLFIIPLLLPFLFILPLCCL